MTDPSNDNGNVRRTEYFALSDLLKRMHPDNPKEHNIGLVIGLIESHGYVELGTIDDRTGLFMAGHGRTEALAVMKQQNMKVPRGIIAKDGEWYVPVSVGYESDNDNKAKSYLVASNESVIAGGWNEPKLAKLLQDIAASTDAVLEDTAMDAERLDELLRDLDYQQEPPPVPEAKINKADELQQKWQVKRGDVWIIPSKTGKRIHRVMCGDSTNAEDVARLMNGEKVDAVVTDPPYGIKLDTDFSKMKSKLFKGKTGSNYHNNIIGDDKPFDPHCILSIECKEMFIFGGDYFCKELPNNGSWLVWDKRLDDSSDKMWGSCFELCWSKNQHKRDIIRVKWAGIFGMETQDTKTRQHPTQKPLEVITWILNKYCGDVIIDPFLGSGTTLVACEQTSRTGYGMEITPEYVAVSLERLSQMGLTPERGDG